MFIRLITIKNSSGIKENALVFRPWSLFLLVLLALIVAFFLTAISFSFGRDAERNSSKPIIEKQSAVNDDLFQGACVPFEVRNFDCALRIFEQLSEKKDLPSPLRQEIVAKRVQCLQHLNRPEAALRIVDSAIVEYPESDLFLQLKAEILLTASKHKATQEFLESLVVSKPGPRVLLLRGKLYLELENYEDAISDLRLVLSTNTPPTLRREAAVILAVLYAEELKDFDEANNCVKILLEPDLISSSSHAVAGRVFLIQKRYEEAKDHLLKAVALDSNNVDALLNLALLFERQGHNLRSSLYLDMASEIDPDRTAKYEALRHY